MEILGLLIVLFINLFNHEIVCCNPTAYQFQSRPFAALQKLAFHDFSNYKMVKVRLIFYQLYKHNYKN